MGVCAKKEYQFSETSHTVKLSYYGAPMVECKFEEK